MPRLRRLDVSGKQRTDSGLWSVSVTDLALDPVASLKELRELNLNGAQVSARGLEKLAGLANLDKLHLYGAKPVRDGAIAVLSSLPRLRWVDLKDTSVTAEGVEKLRAAKPQCVILWQ